MYVADGWYNPLPGWIGLVAIAVIACVFAVVWYKFRQRKNAKAPARFWREPIDGFADVFVTKYYVHDDEEGTVTKEEATNIANSLALARDDIWATCERIYEHVPEHGWCVDKISVVREGMPENHKHVVWGAPHGRIKLLLQSNMYYWFVRECHNVFRYRMYGMAWIYKTKNPKDLRETVAVEEWITNHYGE